MVAIAVEVAAAGVIGAAYWTCSGPGIVVEVAGTAIIVVYLPCAGLVVLIVVVAEVAAAALVVIVVVFAIY